MSGVTPGAEQARPGQAGARYQPSRSHIAGRRVEPRRRAAWTTLAALARARWLDGVLALVCLVSLARFASAVLATGVPAWFAEELPPLLDLRFGGQPIERIDRRQYGVVVFLVFEPAIWLARLGGATSAQAALPFLAWYGLAASALATLVAFLVLARRTVPWQPRWLLVAAIAWLNFVPLLYVVAQRMVDAWQLLFLSVSLALFTGSRRQRQLSAVPLALGTLTKLLPAVVLAYVLVRDRRAWLGGIGTLVVLLGLGHLLYGPLLGFGYPLALLAGGGATVAAYSVHFENNSLRGMLFKLASGFRLSPGSLEMAVPAAWVPPLNLLATGLAALVGLHLLWAAWQGRTVDAPARRAVELSLAVAVMLLVSPHTAQDYLVALLVVFGVLASLAHGGLPGRWRWPLATTAIAAALLVGVFVPVSLAAAVLGSALRAFGGAADVLATVDAAIGSGIGRYQFFGLPGLGLLLVWAVLVRLERWTWARYAGSDRPAGDVDAPGAGQARRGRRGPERARSLDEEGVTDGR